MIENNIQLTAALIQMESFADTLEGMRRHALETENSAFATTSSGFIAMLRERIAETRIYVQTLSDPPNPKSNGPSQTATRIVEEAAV